MTVYDLIFCRLRPPSISLLSESLFTLVQVLLVSTIPTPLSMLVLERLKTRALRGESPLRSCRSSYSPFASRWSARPAGAKAPRRWQTPCTRGRGEVPLVRDIASHLLLTLPGFAEGVSDRRSGDEGVSEVLTRSETF